jgi:hypothetical protein
VFRAVQRERWASSRPIEFLVRRGRSVIRLMHSRSQRRAPEHVEVTASLGWVGSGRNIPWSQKLVVWGEVLEYCPVRR